MKFRENIPTFSPRSVIDSEFPAGFKPKLGRTFQERMVDRTTSVVPTVQVPTVPLGANLGVACCRRADVLAEEGPNLVYGRYHGEFGPLHLDLDLADSLG